jgi:Protein of unknown function (DUF2408)
MWSPYIPYITSAGNIYTHIPSWVLSGAILQSLQESLSELSVELVPVHEKLVHLRRQLATLAAKPKPSKTELKVLQEELRKIDA